MKQRVRELEEQRRRAAAAKAGGAADKQAEAAAAAADLRRRREGQQDQQRRGMENVCASPHALTARLAVAFPQGRPQETLLFVALTSPPFILPFAPQWTRRSSPGSATPPPQSPYTPSVPATCVLPLHPLAPQFPIILSSGSLRGLSAPSRGQFTKKRPGNSSPQDPSLQDPFLWPRANAPNLVEAGDTHLHVSWTVPRRARAAASCPLLFF